ncbi:IS66 family transposase (plasmid) [Rhodobacteraceae bacterium SC52]|nr:IS66 family transposase [Rhodobacteraceae bacterium SC52]
MEIIQKACIQLAGHDDSFVQMLAAEIARADRQRDNENENENENEKAKLQAKLSTATAEIKVLRAKLKRTEAQLKNLQRNQFGPTSEKARYGQDDPDNEEDTNQVTGDVGTGSENNTKTDTCQMPNKTATKKKPRGKRGKQKLESPKHLRRETRIMEPDLDQFCSCGCGAVRMGEQIIEKLAYQPAELYVVEEVYPKYSCRNCDRFVQAKVKSRVFDYTRFDDSTVVGILVAKYADFLPFYRLGQIFGRSGARLNRATLSRLALKAGALLRPIYEALLAEIKSGSKLFADETRIPVLQPGLGRTKTCYAWAICRDDRRWQGNQPPAVAFHFATSREGRHAETILSGFNGILQVDGYAGYNRLTRKDRVGGPLILAFCWAHARRKFEHVEKSTGSSEARDVLRRLSELYKIERELQSQNATALVRQTVRQDRSKPIVDALFDYLELLSSQIMKKSVLGEAIAYTIKLRSGLHVFLSDGRVELDNNLVENTIRPLAVLRKNALFAGSEFGGEVWTVLSSLIGTCKLNGIEPHAYFTWVFEKLANKMPLSECDKLLPWHCPKGRHAI